MNQRVVRKTRICLLLLVLVSFNCGCLSQVSDISTIEVEFDGASDDYYNKYNLWNEVTDSTIINQIIELVDTSKALLLNCPSHRPVMWKISVWVNSKNGKSKHLFRILSNTYDKTSIWQDGRCYENDELIELMIDLMKVEEIKKFEGEMKQSDYDEILLID